MMTVIMTQNKQCIIATFYIHVKSLQTNCLRNLSFNKNKSTSEKTNIVYRLRAFVFIASEESILFSHMGPPKNAIKSLILFVEQFCINHFFILFQFSIKKNAPPFLT